jgi:hypothetical protein
MATAFLTRPLLITAGRGWAQTFAFTLGKGLAEAPDDITGYSAAVTMVQANVAAPASIVITSPDDCLAIDVNALTLTLGAGVTALFTPGDYDFQLRVFLENAAVDRWLVLSNPADSRIKILPGLIP